jgi:outer membrane protein OmpA-like peptidoglycan-associated protein
VRRTNWSFGFGLEYPTYFSSDVRSGSDQINYGAFVSLQHNYFDNVGLRFIGAFDRLEGILPANAAYYYSDGSTAPISSKIHSDIFIGKLDILYYLTPCSVVSPYLGIGTGLVSYKTDWGQVINNNATTKTTIEMNLCFGSEWRISQTLYIKTEFAYNSMDGQLDGIVDNNRKGIFGSNADGYISISSGFQYYFWNNESAKYCEIYSGIKANISNTNNYPTLDEIDQIVRNHIPRVIERKIEIETPVKHNSTNLMLFGINFAANKSKITPESIPILNKAIQILYNNPDIIIEIQGYTDNIENPLINQKLSKERADNVKEYFVSKGIDGNRISTIGFGDKYPIYKNSSEFGRARNRRIEFRIIK